MDLEVVTREQKKDKVLLARSKRDGQKYENEVLQDVKLITHEGNVYISLRLRYDVLKWYHYDLQHPGKIRIYKTISQTIYWPGMNEQCVCLCKKCKACQLSKRLRQNYGKLPLKEDDLKPWHTGCVNCMGPFTVKVKIGRRAPSGRCKH